MKLKEMYKWKIKVGLNENEKYTGINLSGLTQEVILE